MMVDVGVGTNNDDDVKKITWGTGDGDGGSASEDEYESLRLETGIAPEQLADDDVALTEMDLDGSNCFAIGRVARRQNDFRLQRAVRRFVVENFDDVADENEDLLTLTSKELVEILSADALNVADERLVFECIVRWIEYDPANRKKHIVKLLRCVRLGLLRVEYFDGRVKVGTLALYEGYIYIYNYKSIYIYLIYIYIYIYI